MQFDVMTQLIESEFDNIRNVRETKGREYAGEEDTLADFKEVAAEAGITPLQCWLTYVKKHQRAVDTFIREGSVKSEAIEDRIRDIVVYHLLLLGLIEDMKHEVGPQ
jgi:nucleotide-binding universal stress UspA family protein